MIRVNELDRYKPIAEAISLLFFPHVEVVIHDLRTKTVFAIYNNLSKRSVGDESLLDEVNEETLKQAVLPPYLKTNWDGRKMKSVTAIIRGQGDIPPIGLLCMNLDISKWEEMHQFILDMIKPVTQKPDFLFKNDWRERINMYVSTYLKQHALRLETLNKSEKRELIFALYREGAFSTKNAASYIAEVLNISRATVYNYLKEKDGVSTV